MDINLIHISLNDKLYKYSNSRLNRITRLRGAQRWIAWALSSSLWSLQMRYSWRWCAGQTSRWEIPAWKSSVHFFWFEEIDLITGSTKQKAHQLLVFQRDRIRAPKWWYRTSRSPWWYLCEKKQERRSMRSAPETRWVVEMPDEKWKGDTCVAMYAMEPGVTQVIPWRRAFPDLVAFGSLSTELGDVNTCLNAFNAQLSERCIK